MQHEGVGIAAEFSHNEGHSLSHQAGDERHIAGKPVELRNQDAAPRGARHCPKCQWSAAAEWLAAREAELLPVPYFHVVFMLPAAIAAIAYQNKARVYGLLFKAAAETLITIAADPRHLGAAVA